jgi:hypothetical protein
MTAHHTDGHLALSPIDDRQPRPAGPGPEKEATSMRDLPTSRSPRVPDPERYEIRVIGHLARRWVAFFDGMTVAPQDDGTTVIQAAVADQSALHGLLRKLNDLGLPLVSVKPTAEEHPADRTADPSRPTGHLDPKPRSTT